MKILTLGVPEAWQLQNRRWLKCFGTPCIVISISLRKQVKVKHQDDNKAIPQFNCQNPKVKTISLTGGGIVK